MKNIVREVAELLVADFDDTYSITYKNEKINIDLDTPHDKISLYMSNLDDASKVFESIKLESGDLYRGYITINNGKLSYQFDVELYMDCNIDELHKELNEQGYKLDDSYLEYFRNKK